MNATNDTTRPPPLPDLVVEDDELEAAYNAQFVPLYVAARAIHRNFNVVKDLVKAGKVTCRKRGTNSNPRYLVHLTELRRVIREMEIRRPGEAGGAGVTPPGGEGREKVDLRHRGLHPAVQKMIDSKRRRSGRPRVKVYTYFIRAGADGPIKIGKAINLQRRFDTIQCYCPDPVTCVGYLEGNREAELHGRFAAFRLRGEWFKAAPELLAFIAAEARQERALQEQASDQEGDK